MMRFLPSIAFLALSGCAIKQPLTWRIEGQMLVPPGRPTPVAVKTNASCSTGDAIALTRGRGRAVATVRADAAAQQPAGWLAKWASDCASGSDAPAIARRLLDSTPLAVNAPYRTLHADGPRSGYVDVGPENRLQVVTPIGSDETAGPALSVNGSGNSLVVTAEASKGLVGVETAWYAVTPSGIAPVSVSARIQGKLEARDAPAKNLFADIGPGPYRLIYKADNTEVLEAVATGKQVAIPRHVGVNAYLAVSVNGEKVTVANGATVEAVVRAAGKRSQDVLPTLAITKPHHGKQTPIAFDRTQTTVLQLTLLGDEVIRWRSD